MDRNFKEFKNLLRFLILTIFPSEPWFVIHFSKGDQRKPYKVFISFPFEEGFLTDKMTSFLLPKLPYNLSEPIYRKDIAPDLSNTTVNLTHDITVPISFGGKHIGLFWIGTYNKNGFLPRQRKTVAQLSAFIGFMLGVYSQFEKRAEDLFSSEIRFRDLVEGLQEAVFVVEHQRFVYVNPSLCTLLSLRETEILGTSIFQWIYPDDVEAFKIRFQRLMYGEPFPQDYEVRLKDAMGEARQCLLNFGRILHTGKGKFLGTLKDVTDLKTIWDRLYEAQKMETIGTLASGIAHDFNNILGGILGYVSLIKNEAYREGKIYRYAQSIEQNSNRAIRLVKQLLGFSSRGRYKEIPFVLQGTLQRLKDMAVVMFGPSIEVILEMVREPIMVLGDMDQVLQALLNVCMNAKDAMPKGGILKIRMSKKRIFPSKVLSKQKLFPGIYARVIIQDTGFGMDEAVLEKIFDPFFTTKEVGSGVGLGLSMTYGILKNHGGFIEVESAPGRGSTFKIYLPLYEPVSDDVVEKDTLTLAGKGERVLVVDDDKELREAIKTALEGNGYEVVSARDGQEAIRIYRKERYQPFGLIVLDMAMPVMGGQETYWKLKRIDPYVKVILMTGFSIDGDVRDLLQSGVLGYIHKPFRKIELLRAVRTALDLKR